MRVADQLTALVHREVENLQELVGILHREHEALINADVDALEQITSAKSHALSTQADITASRRRLVHAAQGDDTDESLEQLAHTLGDSQLADAVTQLTALATQCNSHNRTNGRLILQKQQHARGALDVLRHTNSANTTYSSRGKASTVDDNGRTLGKA